MITRDLWELRTTMLNNVPGFCRRRERESDFPSARFWIVCVGCNPSRMDGSAVLEL